MSRRLLGKTTKCTNSLKAENAIVSNEASTQHADAQSHRGQQQSVSSSNGCKMQVIFLVNITPREWLNNHIAKVMQKLLAATFNWLRNWPQSKPMLPKDLHKLQHMRLYKGVRGHC